MSKKMNIKNPALNFIEGAKEELKNKPNLKDHLTDDVEVKKETLSRKLNLLVRPSMYVDLSYIAAKRGVSMNNLVNKILENYINGN